MTKILSILSFSLLFISAIFFVVSDVLQLSMRTQTQSLLMVSISSSLAFMILNVIATRLGSKQTNA
jgi:hypothetical protein